MRPEDHTVRHPNSSCLKRGQRQIDKQDLEDYEIDTQTTVTPSLYLFILKHLKKEKSYERSDQTTGK